MMRFRWRSARSFERIQGGPLKGSLGATSSGVLVIAERYAGVDAGKTPVSSLVLHLFLLFLGGKVDVSQGAP